eukprot:NODE_214_length_2924_cov_217.461264_g199_i0.p1 GENE.NODE_214_length_2924_cov_217.461264_g199_i0~~NODE_214_length_2924_cov_217.461264_g199_i0.p1  ORF type:complete len:864 (-),score=214.69 NODE_214_length_2924_cov_217.461264_g199_i0:240-2831(-)
MAVATAQRRTKLAKLVEDTVAQDLVADPKLKKLLTQWLKDRTNGDKGAAYHDELLQLLEANRSAHKNISVIHDGKDLLPNISQWVIGGDGWANDIGFGGLDHILASGQNINVLVLDTEMYSNTGGQASKSSNVSSVSKFALGGKASNKKALGEMAMTYGNVYVASVSHGNMAHLVKSFVEAESYDGPSLLMCYAPCIEHGLRTGMAKMIQESEAAIACGYWPLYRHDPRLATQEKNPFTLDSKRTRGDPLDFIKRENRFINLEKNNPKAVAKLRGQLSTYIKARLNRYQRMADSHKKTTVEADGPRVTILYGSETGNAESLSKDLATDFERRDYSVAVQALNDVDLAELPHMGFVVFCISTCGQGAWPKNSQLFWAELQKAAAPDSLKDLKYTVFGLGDSSYYFFNHTAKLIDARLADLGAKRVMAAGFGDDGDEDRFETAFNQWAPTLWTTLGTKTPEESLFEPSIAIEFTPDGHPSRFHHPKTKPVSSKSGAVRITPEDYGRNFVTIEWSTDLPYRIGDSFGVYPENPRADVEAFLRSYMLDPKAVITIQNQGTRALPECTTLEDLFGKVLDVFGKPNRRFYKSLAHFATDVQEKARLAAMGQGEGEYSDMMMETRHYADVLRMFPSARPPLLYLIEMIPNLKPRLYSISSSPKHTPGEVHSLVLIDTWVTPSGNHRTGLTCTMLEKLQKGDIVDGLIHPTAMEFPDSDERPMVMAGIGSGLAPFVAFLRERSWKRKQGIKVGHMVLYFGNRYEATEYLMKEELQSYVAEGLLSLRTAFSRDDGKKKVYVQDLVKQDPDLLHDLLVKQGGSMYVCGSRQMPKPVENSLKHCFMTAGQMSADEAEKHIISMYTTGKYNIESW